MSATDVGVVQYDDRDGEFAGHRRSEPGYHEPGPARPAGPRQVPAVAVGRRDGPAERQRAGLPWHHFAGFGKRQRAGQLEFQLRPVVSTVAAGTYGFSAVATDAWGTSAHRHRPFSSRSAAARRRARPSMPRESSPVRRRRAAWSRSSMETWSWAWWLPTPPATGSLHPRYRG